MSKMSISIKKTQQSFTSVLLSDGFAQINLKKFNTENNVRMLTL